MGAWTYALLTGDLRPTYGKYSEKSAKKWQRNSNLLQFVMVQYVSAILRPAVDGEVILLWKKAIHLLE